jgi:hypothetical protein
MGKRAAAAKRSKKSQPRRKKAMAKARDEVVGTEEENPRGDAAGVKALGEQKAFDAAGEGASTHDGEREGVAGLASAPRRAFSVKEEAAINALHRRMMQTMPSEAASGFVFIPAEGHALFELETESVEDGKYRVQGSDWIMEIEGGKFKSASKAMPPDYGGEDVMNVRGS